MNLTFLDSAIWWDVLFALLLILCIRGGAKRGAFRPLSGIAGTILGVILGTQFQDRVAVYLEPVLRPVLRSLSQKADLSSALNNLQQGTPLYELLQEHAGAADKMSAVYQAMLDSLSESLTASLAPIVAFILIFLVTKLIIRIVCALLDLDIPLFSGLNHLAGGLLGALAGLVLIIVLCWAVLRFAPAENVSILSRPCLLESFVGGLIGPFAALFL